MLLVVFFKIYFFLYVSHDVGSVLDLCVECDIVQDLVLRLCELNALRFAANHIPERTPKQWDIT